MLQDYPEDLPGRGCARRPTCQMYVLCIIYVLNRTWMDMYVQGDCMSGAGSKFVITQIIL